MREVRPALAYFAKRLALWQLSRESKKNMKTNRKHYIYIRQARLQSIHVDGLNSIKFFEVRHVSFKEDFKSLPIYFKSVFV
jgi:hypothetical protein